MLRILPRSSTGTSIAAMIITPPIDGTPTLFTPNGSMEASRWVSLICFLRRYLMNFSPNQADIISERISARSARNDMYPHM